MKNIKFEREAVIRRAGKLGAFKRVIAGVFKLAMVVMVVANTYGYYKITRANHEQILVRKVEVNADKINDLENGLLRQEATSDSLSYNPADLMEANVIIIAKSDRGSAKGSGSIIRVEKEYTYILTAAHVISEPVIEINDKGVLGYVNKESVDIMIKYGNGFKKKVRAQVQKVDYKLDVAVLKVLKKINVTPIKISQVEPQMGDVVWSLSNPGSFEGVINKGIFSSVEEDYSYVALAGFFGSSGGMCLNNKGEQIGVISTVAIARVSYSKSLTVYNGITRTGNLNNFLKGIVK